MARQRAEAHAARLLDEHDDLAPPISLEVLARRLGADVKYRNFEGDGTLSGVLIRDEGRAVIGVNAGHPTSRQRFTIAHELGHLLLHPGRPLIVDQSVRVNRRDQVSSSATDLEEIEANQFAAALLMPSERVLAGVRRLLDERGDDLPEGQLAASLAGEFQVSAQAMGFRLVNLGVLPSGSWD